MKKAKGQESPSFNAGSAAPSAEQPKRGHVSLNPIWLLGLAALVVIPWLVVATIYLRQTEATTESKATAEPGSVLGTRSPGPWGSLSTTSILISPPLEFVAADWGRESGSDEWFFPGTRIEEMENFLKWAGLSAEQISSIRATARPDPRTNGLIVKPGPDLVRNLPADVRARLYNELGKTTLNFDQANAFRFQGSKEEWFGGGVIQPATKEQASALLYADGEFLAFADPEIMTAQITSVDERRRLAKVLLRQKTVVVKLRVEDAGQVDSLTEYWGRGGRRTDLRPLLESVADLPDRSIDIVHLLPAFVRNHLYRYPRLRVADMNQPVLANCLWSSLNFFNERPDDRYLNVDEALKTLQKDYYVVQDKFQLGDVVTFVDQKGNLFHVASYLADGLVFSKNGTSPVSPWAITTVETLKGYYRSRSTNPAIIYHRRNDL